MKYQIIVLLITGMLIACNEKDSGKDSQTQQKTTSVAIEQDSTITQSQLKAITTDQDLITTALMAAPKDSRAEATVIGYNMAGEFVTLKAGTNEFIVLADDPKKPGFSAACYHKDLDPFMARGRELKAQGKTATEIFNIREEEAKSGKLDMGPPGTTLHIYFGEGELYDPDTGIVAGARYRYVVYLPFATAESTGLPTKPIGSNHPWIMNPGTHRAHIMISPLPEEKN